jgi:hypothetical protein
MILRYHWVLLLLLGITACGSGTSSARNNKWKGNWERVDSQDGAELEIKKINGDTLTFVLFATNGASFSRLEGTALVEGNRATFLADAEGHAAECEVVFELNNSSISILEGGSECGNAMYVWYAGVYGKEKK